MTVALCAMNHSSPWNTTLRSPSENTAMVAADYIGSAPRVRRLLSSRAS
jgi:hypothetical protein